VKHSNLITPCHINIRNRQKRGSSGQIERKIHVTHDFMTLPNGSTNLSDLTISRQRWWPSPRKAVAMQHRTSSPNTQSRASVKLRASIQRRLHREFIQSVTHMMQPEDEDPEVRSRKRSQWSCALCALGRGMVGGVTNKKTERRVGGSSVRTRITNFYHHGIVRSLRSFALTIRRQ